MTQALVTIVAPLSAEKLKILPDIISQLGNPASAAIRAGLDQLDADGQSGTHFASMHAIPASGKPGGYIILEFSADGAEHDAIARLAHRIGEPLRNVFSHATDWRDSTDIANYLTAHQIHTGFGWFDSPGVGFPGTPAMTVGRIRRERDLAAELTEILGAQGPDHRALDRLNRARLAIADKPDFAWASRLPPPAIPPKSTNIVTIALGFIGSFATNFLWPFGIVLLAWVAAVFIMEWAAVDFMWVSLWTPIAAALNTLWEGALIELAIVLALLVVLYISLTTQEAGDTVDERMPSRAVLDEILKRENFGAQNHMVSVTETKPGFVRQFTIRLIFWAIAQFVTRVYKPGFLSDIGTIHFARWITVPGTRDFVFFSNFGGSWESYLEDFITRAHFGLTGVWSNSVGFPRTRNLVQDGATDGERFKRYARRSMLPTPFWYSAYTDTTTAHVRANEAIRRGFASAVTNEEALDWLALFGSAKRPDAKLESSEIQSLVFGGLGFMRYGVCALYRLPADQANAQRFLRRIAPLVAYNDGRRLQTHTVVTLGLGPNALTKLGLPEDCVDGFPAAFLNGMSSRARILGDIDDANPSDETNALAHWLWGRNEAIDLALLIYGETEEGVANVENALRSWSEDTGATSAYRIPLKPVEPTGAKTEPFGFVDGISQPLIRGTYKSLREPDAIHLVEPGEFILGYPDNRGNIPPGPSLSPLLDPHNRLPIAADDHDFTTNIVSAPRDIGRNGTFLVIRHLEQNVAAFAQYCEEEAERVSERLSPPYVVDAEFIGAKLVGRWKDGSSLVRHPYRPRTEQVSGTHRLQANSSGENPQGPYTGKHAAKGQPAAQAQPESQQTTRATTAPDHSKPIEKSPDVRRADNDFLFGEEDPEALRCPYGAHIRRSNPRESLDPGSQEQIDITNRHRLLRVGRFYDPEPGRDPGLLFMCLNGDLERQFEFIQQTWLASTSFHGLVGEQDPIVGGDPRCKGYVIPTRDGPVRLAPLKRFVKTLGGGYFFLPSKRLLAFLGGDE